MIQTKNANRIRLSNIQKLIGRLMQQSKRQVPAVYLECCADITELISLRKGICRGSHIRITTNDFFLLAIARAIKKFPLMAGAFNGNSDYIQISRQIGVGLAVSAPQGLVVPILQDMVDKSLAQTAAQSAELLQKARANKLMPNDFYGANVVLSSLGMYGVNSFYAIAPPHAAGIISIGTINDTVIASDDGLAVRKTMQIALAADRRIMDELYAAQFLRCVLGLLENPRTLTQ